MDKLNVTPFIINKGQPTQIYGLKDKDDNQVLYGSPYWKTEKGAKNWAEKHGMNFIPYKEK